ncbi:MAG: NTP transferase domain-containing protein, partial [Bacteroidetes bacterium]|nr:NTP transferase domain-containing protein [Bacteroidota bacterium]
MKSITLLAEENLLENPSQAAISPVKNAVILAAGKSSRFREQGVLKPKVLMKVGGLRLLERAILTLHETGVERFRIVVGAYKEQVLAEMRSIARLREIDIEYVECVEYELGNGVTFAAGAAGFSEAFLLTMSDHIFAPDTVRDFIQKTKEAPQLPALACDGDLENVFDMDDATKVASRDGFIHNIGKEIKEYDLVDTGLFYFPAGYGSKIEEKARQGAHSVSGIIQHFIDGDGVRAVELENAMWQDVDDPNMKREAERRLLKMFPQPEKTLVSHFVSGPASLALARTELKPYHVTAIVFLMSMVASAFAAAGHRDPMLIGSSVFLLASLFDGADSSLARMTYQTSRFGEWFQRFLGSLRYLIFFSGIGISGWRSTHSDFYLFGVFMFWAVGLYLLSQMATFAWNRREQPDEPFLPSPFVRNFKRKSVARLIGFLQTVTRPDVLALLTFALGLFFKSKAMFWVGLAGTMVSAIAFSKSVHVSKVKTNKANPVGNLNPIYFFLLGIGILAALVFYLDFTVVNASLAAAGNKVFVVFSVALLWIVTNTLCTRTLVQGKVPFPDLLYNQITGEAYNTILPLAAVGGEPYRIQHLTNWLDWHTASRAVVVDRLIRAITGTLFAATCLTLTLVLVDLSDAVFITLAVLAAVHFAAGIGMTWISLSSAPSKFIGYVLKKMKMVDE